jgi:hypothetical protein
MQAYFFRANLGFLYGLVLFLGVLGASSAAVADVVGPCWSCALTVGENFHYPQSCEDDDLSELLTDCATTCHLAAINNDDPKANSIYQSLNSQVKACIAYLRAKPSSSPSP